MDGRTNGWTHPLIEMRGASKNNGPGWTEIGVQVITLCTKTFRNIFQKYSKKIFSVNFFSKNFYKSFFQKRFFQKIFQSIFQNIFQKNFFQKFFLKFFLKFFPKIFLKKQLHVTDAVLYGTPLPLPIPATYASSCIQPCFPDTIIITLYHLFADY